MSKLAHSHQPTMDELDRQRWEEDNNCKIITEHVYPPIPIRHFDWQAHIDGHEPNDDGHMLVGRGATEMDAIVDLITTIEESR